VEGAAPAAPAAEEAKPWRRKWVCLAPPVTEHDI
jgi:hypothetical protein